MTDNAWTGSSFRNTEGILKLTILPGGISAGTVFGYGDANLQYGSDWVVDNGNFKLSNAGDTILVYCLESGSRNVVHLGGFSFSNNWPDRDPSSYRKRKSALPVGLRS
eukprot:12977918-Ditylum_brightwellii.AAC.1